MQRYSLAFLCLALGLSALPAHAVQTRLCPTTIALDVHRFDYFTDAQIRGLPAHAKYTDKMFTSASLSKDALVAATGSSLPGGTFVLNYRKNGKCIYTVSAPNLEQNKITLSTSNGTDWMRYEFAFKKRNRDTESFAVRAALSSYDPNGIEIDHRVTEALLAAVDYSCYDRICQTDAQIGDVEFSSPKIAP